MEFLSNSNTPEVTDKAIWAMADENNFEAIITALLKAGVNENSMGEILFTLAKQAITQERLNSGRIILQFLVNSLDNKAETFPLIKIVGDLYKLEKNYKMAREYYRKLPMEQENISLYLQTFDLKVDFDALLNVRNQLLVQIEKSNRQQVHDIVDEIVKSFMMINSGLLEEHKKRYDKNLTFLEKFAPAIAARLPSKYNYGTGTTLEQFTIKIADDFYGREKGIWFKIINRPESELDQDSLNKNENILVRCPDQSSCLNFVKNLAAIGKTFYRHGCLVIMDLQILVQIMAVYDLAHIEDSAFVIRIVDENNLKDDLRKILLQEKVVFTSTMVNNYGPNQQYYEQILRPLLHESEKEIMADIDICKRKLAALYPRNFHKKVVKKIKNGKKLRVLFYTSRYSTYVQYSIRDMAEGFRLLGHKVFIEQEKEKAACGIRMDVALGNLCKFRPDIIFSIDHLRYELPYIPQSIPFITWVQDLLPNIYAIDDPLTITDQDYIFSFAKKWADNYLSNPKIFKQKKLFVLPVIVDSKIYCPLPDVEKTYDVTFVTHLYAPADTLYAIAWEEFTDESSPLEQQLIQQLVAELETYSLSMLRELQMYEQARKGLIVSLCEKNNLPVTGKLLKIVNWLSHDNKPHPFWYHIHLLIKMNPVSNLLKNNVAVKVFGKNWEKYPNTRHAAMGVIENGAKLNKLFNQSRINLNASPGTTYHMKAPEVIAAKSFMLTCRIPAALDSMPIEDFFEKDKEVVLFDDENDLLEKVNFYLAHPEDRQKIAAKAYEKYNKKYSCQASVLNILAAIKNTS